MGVSGSEKKALEIINEEGGEIAVQVVSRKMRDRDRLCETALHLFGQSGLYRFIRHRNLQDYS